jgi:hypothetical protein
VGPIQSLSFANGYLFAVAFGTKATLYAIDVTQPDVAPWPPPVGTLDLIANGHSPTAVGQGVTDGATLYIPYLDGSADSGFISVDIRDPAVLKQLAVISAGAGITPPAAALPLAAHDVFSHNYPVPRLGLQRHRLFLSVTAQSGSDCQPWIVVFNVTDPANPQSLAPLTFPLVPGCGRGSGLVDLVGDVAPQGQDLFYVYRRFDAVQGTAHWGLGISRLSPARDGAGATSIMPGLGASENDLPLSGLALAGDTLYARINLGGLASWDLTPVFLAGQPARFLVSQGTSDGYALSSDPYQPALSPVIIEGPWAFMLNGRLQVYDLR